MLRKQENKAKGNEFDFYVFAKALTICINKYKLSSYINFCCGLFFTFG